MGVGLPFPTKIVIFRPICPISAPEIGLAVGNRLINRRNGYQLNWGQRSNVNNQSKWFSRQVMCFSSPFLTKIMILCQFDLFLPLKLGKIPFSRFSVGFSGIHCMKRKQESGYCDHFRGQPTFCDKRFGRYENLSQLALISPNQP